MFPVHPEGVRTLPEAIQPWKDLTDRFDDLSIWLDELEGRVECDLVRVQEEGVEGGDPLDLIVNIKVELMLLEIVGITLG